MRKLWHISTMDYYSFIERNETVKHTTRWKGAEDTVLNEGSQTQKATYDSISVK